MDTITQPEKTKLQIYDADIPSLKLCKVQAKHYDDLFRAQWKGQEYSTHSEWKDVVMKSDVLYNGTPMLYTWYVCLPVDVCPVLDIYRSMFGVKPSGVIQDGCGSSIR